MEFPKGLRVQLFWKTPRVTHRYESVSPSEMLSQCMRNRPISEGGRLCHPRGFPEKLHPRIVWNFHGISMEIPLLFPDNFSATLLPIPSVRKLAGRGPSYDIYNEQKQQSAIEAGRSCCFQSSMRSRRSSKEPLEAMSGGLGLLFVLLMVGVSVASGYGLKRLVGVFPE